MPDMRMGQEYTVDQLPAHRRIDRVQFDQLRGDRGRRVEQIAFALFPVDQAERAGQQHRPFIPRMADLRSACILPGAKDDQFALALPWLLCMSRSDQRQRSQCREVADHSITRPRTITQSTCSSTVTSASGLPSTAMMSAE